MRYGNDEELMNNTNYFTEETGEIIKGFENLRDFVGIMSYDGSFGGHHLAPSKIHRIPQKEYSPNLTLKKQ